MNHKKTPTRLFEGFNWENEHELVDWYTMIGVEYPYKHKFPKNHILRWFMSESDKKLEKALERNNNVVTDEME